MRILFAILMLILCISQQVTCVNERLEERYSWRMLEFQFPNNRTRQQLIDSGEYIPINNVPLGTEIWRDRYFITVPRWLTGIAATLTYFRISGSSRSPVLIPYPNYEMNHLQQGRSYENKIVSVFRPKVDACDRLWFIDTGLIDIIGAYSQVIAPRLFIYDLNTDRLIRRYTFNSSNLSELTLFGGNLVVDVTADRCNSAFAYIPDFGGYRMVVYSYAENDAWRIKHPYFYFDPFASVFNFRDNIFLWTDGVFGAALSPIHRNDEFRTLYFTSISTTHQYSVSTRILRDRSMATNTSVLMSEYRLLGSRGTHMQTTANMLHEQTGVLFYTLVNRNGIGCWNSITNANNYSPSALAVLATDDETMVFPNDIIFDDSETTLWLLTDRLPISNNGRLVASDINFRLFSATVTDLIAGTVCDPNSATATRFGASEKPAGQSLADSVPESPAKPARKVPSTGKPLWSASSSGGSTPKRSRS